jgi:hypothetical protein
MNANPWYEELVEDCRSIIVEHSFTSRWALIEGYHNLGTRILDDYERLSRDEKYGKEIAKRVASSLGKSERSIELSMQFARQYPDLALLPEGKNTSWRDICHKYLPRKGGHWKAQVDDYSVLPEEFKKANMTLLDKLGQESQGKAVIPGVSFIEEEREI